MACIDDLAEAEAALHKLTLGESVVSLQFEGEAVTYRQSDVAQLRRYIRDLKSKCGDTDGIPRRPVQVYF